ncbi:MAG: ABC transporter ATP-binding protein [Anaerolineales bacterium]|nr:ABC transporter ATP-binding protein [Anaerolineales bacterium]
MKNATFWKWVYRQLHIRPLDLAEIAGLTAAQFASIGLIAWVFQGAVSLPPRSTSVVWRAAAMCVFAIVNAFGIYLSRTASAHIANRAAGRMRVDLLDFLYSRSDDYFARTNSGALHASVVWDTERVEKFNETLLGKIIPALLVGAGIGLVLLWLNPVLVALLLLALPFLLLASRFSLRRLKRQTDRRNVMLRSYTQNTLTAVQHIGLTRIQTAESQETAFQSERIQSLRRESEALSRIQAFHDTVQTGLQLGVVGVLLIVGGGQVSAGQTTLGGLLAFNAVLIALRRYVQDAVSSVPALVDGVHALETLFRLVRDAPPEPYHGSRELDFKGAIQLRGVTFRYGENEPILRQADLTFEPRTLTVLVGANGSGKTTLVNLILGFYRPQQGGLFADGRPYEELDIRSLRRRLGVLPQDPVILDGTIWENIVYGIPDATRESVREAAEKAMAHDFIAELPEGYDTLVGERGVRLSGGQRQRIALARALARRPAVLILDEPTNHLDTTATQRLIETLMNVENTPTTIVISHEEALAQQTNRIFRLQAGSLVANGSPVPKAGFPKPP